MKMFKRLLSSVLCMLFMLPMLIRANEIPVENNTNEIKTDQENEEFTELTREEFIAHISKNNGISSEQAESEVDQRDFAALQERALNGEVQPRAMILHYGYFDSYFYTPTDQYNDPNISTCARFGVYASYYYPDAGTTWASRRFNAVHDSYLYEANDYTILNLYSKYAYINGPYTVVFNARFEMKRDVPFMYYVEYTISHNFYI